MAVVVQRNLQVPLPDPERNYVTGREVARLPCGCEVWTGIRKDNGQAATVANPCSRDHRKTVAVRFNERMKSTLPSQSTEPLIDVVARILADCA